MVTPLKAISDRRKRGEESGPAEATDVELLAEIRDLLRAQAAGSVASGRHADPENPDGGPEGRIPHQER